MKYKFFWSSDSPFSNWYPSMFVYDGFTFYNSEQAMMYAKAKLFKDEDMMRRIRLTPDPRAVKALGRKVRGFDSKIWDECKVSVVKDILTNKFTHNNNLLLMLKRYEGCTFVEASPYDRIWGIGYDAHNAIQNFNNWGENLLGKILTELSVEL